jgi:UDP-N-acetylmuramoyl-L-alanyl-D-glutamate--2,6-diaminopimelate ligase
MTLTTLLQGVTVVKMFHLLYGKSAATQELEIRELRYDSRKVGPGDLFVAIRGTEVDGHRFVPDALARGARVVVVEDDAAVPDALCLHEGAAKIVVPDARKALATMAATFTGHPGRRLTLVGVTGTNGKTTTTHLIKSVLEAHGNRVGLIGTTGTIIGPEKIPSTHTTPESLELNRLLAEMVARGCTAAVMEVSSHALSLSRVHGLSFAAGVFTNLTQDHLDFHGTMGAYSSAKRLLFDGLEPGATAVINADDPAAKDMVAGTRARILRYGIGAPADVVAEGMEVSLSGTRFTLRNGGTYSLSSVLVGDFNVQNLLAACSTGIALGIPGETIVRGIAAAPPVRGRFERVSGSDGRTAIIDYAHTPDALDHCLRAVRRLLPAGGGRIITVFGCGGNRDRGKRPIMGRIASELSDMTIITSDNPRREDPLRIIDEIRAGIRPGAAVETEPDRHTAIRRGLDLAVPGDVVLVAGKGHETSQVLRDTTLHFDDREEVEQYLGTNR